MFGKDLVVMVDFDPTKTIDEVEFIYIPIWIRVLKLPFGMMNKATGEAIGNKVGIFMAMDGGDDDMVTMIWCWGVFYVSRSGSISGAL